MKNFTILQQCYARKLKEVEIREENINKMSGTESKKKYFWKIHKEEKNGEQEEIGQ